MDVLNRMRTVGAVVAIVALLATACSRKEDGAAASPSATDRPTSSSSDSSSSAATSSSAAPAALQFSPAAGSQSVNPTAPVKVSALDGELTSVKLVNPTEGCVSGAMARDRHSWSATEVLGYGKTYTLTAPRGERRRPVASTYNDEVHDRDAAGT